MKLSEALIQRKDLTNKINDLQNRLISNSTAYEGQAPSENPLELLTEMGNCVEELSLLIKRVNHTNNVSLIEETKETISDAVVRRDMLKMRMGHLETALQHSSNTKRSRYSASSDEPKLVSVMEPKDLRKSLDSFYKLYRELDLLIQAANWKYDLLELKGEVKIKETKNFAPLF